MFDVFAQTGASGAVNWMLEIIKLVLPALFGFAAVLLGLGVWHRKRRNEPKYQSLEYLSRKRLDGLLKAWSLLAYMTDVENPKAVILWEKNGNETTYYLNPACAREYMAELSESFYSDGYGLLLDRNVKKLLYEYRGILYSVLLKNQSLQGSDDMIKLNNEKMIQRIKEIYNQLNSELRKEREKIG